MDKRKKTLRGLKYLVAFLVPVFFVLALRTEVDNDSWFVLAEGREIVRNGIYHIDQLSMHEGLEVTVQNYGFAILYYLIYVALGVRGLYLGMLACLFGVEFLLYKIYKTISDDNEKLSISLMILTTIVLDIAFVTTRAQMLSFLFFLGTIYVLERYIRDGKKKRLCIIPCLSLAMINLHASVWLMLFLVMVAYILGEKLDGKQKVGPIIIVAIAAFLMGFVNPYGIKMMIFVVQSYLIGGYDLILEMQPFSLTSSFGKVMYGLIIGVILFGFYGDRKKVKIRYLILWIVLLALGLNTIKGMSWFILVAVLVIIPMYKNIKIPSMKIESKIVRRGLIGVAGGFAALTGTIGVLIVKGLKDYPNEDVVGAISRLDEEIEKRGEDKKEVKVFTDYNDGGYFEFMGYKPYIDPRAEVFYKINNKKEDIFAEYRDFVKGKIRREEFLEKYNFEYIVAEKENPFLWSELEGFEKIFEDEETGLTVLAKTEGD